MKLKTINVIELFADDLYSRTDLNNEIVIKTKKDTAITNIEKDKWFYELPTSVKIKDVKEYYIQSYINSYITQTNKNRKWYQLWKPLYIKKNLGKVYINK